MITRRRRWNVWLCDEDARAAVPSATSFRVVKRPCATSVRNLFVFCSAIQLPQVAQLVSAVNRRNQLMALFLRQDADSVWLPQLMRRANLRAIKNLMVFSDLELPRRVLNAWQHGAEHDLIARAMVAGDRLFVTSCVPETMDIGFEEIPALSQIPRRQRAEFELSSDGSFIRWPSNDVHLSLDTIRCAIDPVYREQRDAAQLTRLRNWGEAIARLRKQHGLRQSDVPGLSERQLRRIECGAQPTLSALKKLAAGHGMELRKYLEAVAENAKTPNRP